MQRRKTIFEYMFKILYFTITRLQVYSECIGVGISQYERQLATANEAFSHEAFSHD